MNVDGVLDDVTSSGREFHVRDAAAGKAQSAMVWRRVEGTMTTDVNDERSLRRPGRSVTGWRCLVHFHYRNVWHIGTRIKVKYCSK